MSCIQYARVIHCSHWTCVLWLAFNRPPSHNILCYVCQYIDGGVVPTSVLVTMEWCDTRHAYDYLLPSARRPTWYQRTVRQYQRFGRLYLRRLQFAFGLEHLVCLLLLMVVELIVHHFVWPAFVILTVCLVMLFERLDLLSLATLPSHREDIT